MDNDLKQIEDALRMLKSKVNDSIAPEVRASWVSAQLDVLILEVLSMRHRMRFGYVTGGRTDGPLRETI